MLTPVKSFLWVVVIVYTFFDFNSKKDSDTTIDQSKILQQEAFSVLNTKCNFCHEEKRNRTIFTLENMNTLTKTIEYQVFTTRKMPKGRKNKLSSSEEEKLKNWMNSLHTP